MKTKTQYFFLLAFGIFASACGPSASVDTVASNMVNSSQIYQDYRVSGDSSQTRITATFRVGGSTGTTVELTAPGKILYNGSPMKFSPPGGIMNIRTKGTTYETSLPNFETVNKFDYTDAGGKTYTNSINLQPIQFAVQKPVVLQKAKSSTIMLSRPVEAGEKLSITMDESLGDDIPTKNDWVSFNPGRNAIIIAPQFWATKSSPAKIQFKIRIYKTASVIQAAAVGGSMFAEYKAAPISVSINKTGKPAANANTSAGTDIAAENDNAAANSTAKTANKTRHISAGRKRLKRSR